MSNKSKRRRNATRSNRTLIFLAGGILMLAAAGLAFAISQPTASQPAVPVTVNGSPRLQVDQELIDFGEVPVGKMVTASFTLSNTGDQPLVFSHPPVPTVVEGC